MEFFDFDANFCHKDLNKDIDTLLSTASDVKMFIVPGSDLEDSTHSLQLSADYENIIFTTVGIHPFNVLTTPFCEDSVNTFKDLSSKLHCLAIGECGLDYSEGFPNRENQKTWFRVQVEWALSLNKPLYLHSRDAELDFIQILQEFGFGTSGCPPPRVACVVHCFTGATSELMRYLDFGFIVGLTGYIFKLDRSMLAEWLHLITLDRLVIETDAPYLGFKGCRTAETTKQKQRYPNVPSALPQIAALIAEVGGWDIADVARITSLNARRFIGK